MNHPLLLNNQPFESFNETHIGRCPSNIYSVLLPVVLLCLRDLRFRLLPNLLYNPYLSGCASGLNSREIKTFKVWTSKYDLLTF